MIIISVDPGKASGIAVIQWERSEPDVAPALFWSVESQPEDFATDIREAFHFALAPEEYAVACESFVINAQTVKNSQAPYSLEQIGVLKHLCRENGYDPSQIAFQAPVNAKNMFPNPALKKLGLWHRGGEGHALDAIRHGALRLVKAGWTPRALLE